LDVLGLGTLGVFNDIKLNDLTFSKSPEARHSDCGMVYEYVLPAVIALDETETLLIIKPLHFARGHTSDSLQKAWILKQNKKPRTPGPSMRGSISIYNCLLQIAPHLLDTHLRTQYTRGVCETQRKSTRRPFPIKRKQSFSAFASGVNLQ
jgi:hypothetical protein